MGLLDIFKTPREIAKEEIVEVPWHVLGKMDQLDEIVEESKLTDAQLKLYYLDLLQNRDISNEIAARFKVNHESPQMIVIKNGAVVHHDSHHSIEASHLKRFV